MRQDKDKVVHDPLFGDVIFRKSDRAKRYFIKIRDRVVSVVLPRLGSYKFAEELFASERDKVAQILQKQPIPDSTQYDEELLRKQAKAYLPGRLAQLAREHGFSYCALRIRKSRSNWGSCSVKRNINLSIFLMLLPEHLVDYVILHELCHTIHMNHSPEFWSLLDKHTGNRAKQLRKELRNYATPARQ